MTRTNRIIAPTLAVIGAFLLLRPGDGEGETGRQAAAPKADDEIHAHGYDLSKAAPAGQTVRMSFKATITGILEIEFEKAGTLVADLEVRP